MLLLLWWYKRSPIEQAGRGWPGAPIITEVPVSLKQPSVSGRLAVASIDAMPHHFEANINIFAALGLVSIEFAHVGRCKSVAVQTVRMSQAAIPADSSCDQAGVHVPTLKGGSRNLSQKSPSVYTVSEYREVLRKKVSVRVDNALCTCRTLSLLTSIVPTLNQLPPPAA